MERVSRPPSPTAAHAGAARARPKPASRPGGAKPSEPKRRSTPARVDREENRAPRQITVRTLVFAIVILMAFVLITPTLRAYVRQQEELRELNTELAAAQEEARDLEAAVRRWNNDEFIRSQARERFGFVLPGEISYRVVDPETILGEEAELEADLVAAIPVGSGPWYMDVWESIRVAGEMEHDAGLE